MGIKKIQQLYESNINIFNNDNWMIGNVPEARELAKYLLSLSENDFSNSELEFVEQLLKKEDYITKKRTVCMKVNADCPLCIYKFDNASCLGINIYSRTEYNVTDEQYETDKKKALVYAENWEAIKRETNMAKFIELVHERGILINDLCDRIEASNGNS